MSWHWEDIGAGPPLAAANSQFDVGAAPVLRIEPMLLQERPSNRTIRAKDEVVATQSIVRAPMEIALRCFLQERKSRSFRRLGMKEHGPKHDRACGIFVGLN